MIGGLFLILIIGAKIIGAKFWKIEEMRAMWN